LSGGQFTSATSHSYNLNEYITDGSALVVPPSDEYRPDAAAFEHPVRTFALELIQPAPVSG
jgi:hypothetical protein